MIWCRWIKVSAQNLVFLLNRCSVFICTSYWVLSSFSYCLSWSHKSSKPLILAWKPPLWNVDIKRKYSCALTSRGFWCKCPSSRWTPQACWVLSSSLNFLLCFHIRESSARTGCTSFIFSAINIILYLLKATISDLTINQSLQAEVKEFFPEQHKTLLKDICSKKTLHF